MKLASVQTDIKRGEDRKTLLQNIEPRIVYDLSKLSLQGLYGTALFFQSPFIRHRLYHLVLFEGSKLQV